MRSNPSLPPSKTRGSPSLKALSGESGAWENVRTDRVLSLPLSLSQPRRAPLRQLNIRWAIIYCSVSQPAQPALLPPLILPPSSASVFHAACPIIGRLLSAAAGVQPLLTASLSLLLPPRRPRTAYRLPPRLSGRARQPETSLNQQLASLWSSLARSLGNGAPHPAEASLQNRSFDSAVGAQAR